MLLQIFVVPSAINLCVLIALVVMLQLILSTLSAIQIVHKAMLHVKPNKLLNFVPATNSVVSTGLPTLRRGSQLAKRYVNF